MTSNPIQIQSFYQFKKVVKKDLPELKTWLTQNAQDLNVRGLVILGEEGINTTLSSSSANALNKFVTRVANHLNLETPDVKRSTTHKRAFKRFTVKIRDEIVTLGKPEFVPQGNMNHLSPEKWNELLDSPDSVVIDTRNDYEFQIGTFEKAIDMGLKEFHEFPEKIKQLETDKSKPHLIFCTGGIRCEKAIFEMKEQGFEEVYQLDGGILNYIEKAPNQKFKGECFVFDSRVAVDQSLEPSKQYSLCSHCGEVSEVEIQCLRCDSPGKICRDCHTKAEDEQSPSSHLTTCSKNCAYHYKLHPGRKGLRQTQFFHT